MSEQSNQEELAEEELPSSTMHTASGTHVSLKRAKPQDGDMDRLNLSHKDDDGDDGWTRIKNGQPVKKRKKLPSISSRKYPAIVFSDNARLQSKVNLSQLRDLILYIHADGPAPNWIAVQNRPEFRKFVAIMVPGLEEAMFEPDVDLAAYRKCAVNSLVGHRKASSPDEYYPRILRREYLPQALRPFADMFQHIWPIRTSGDDRYLRLHSPLQTVLFVPFPKSKDKAGPKPMRDPSGWRDEKTRITEFLLSPEEYTENGFRLHPAFLACDDERQAFNDPEGWVHTKVGKLTDGNVPEMEIEQGSITAGREVFALDCEMCVTGDTGHSLTRISIVSWDGEVILDELVKPAKPITDYVTRFSGITREMLEPVTTTLQEIQQRLLRLLHPRSILLGHSLDSDLKALQLTHPFIVDSSILFPHVRGPPLKNSLKYLAQKFLGREVQRGDGTEIGHDSIEDARTCLDLVKKKCQKGVAWAAGESPRENIFNRLARAGTAYRSTGGLEAKGGIPIGKSSAAIEWGDLSRSCFNAATVQISCNSDADVEAGVVRAVRGDHDGLEVPSGGVDFVWARMRELEAARGWCNREKTYTDTEGTWGAQTVHEEAAADLAATIRALTERLARIHQALPPCTAFLVFSGSGDPREMVRLQAMQARFKKEYNTLGSKWDQISVKWTDVEDQALRIALREARSGIGFIGVK